MAIEPIKYEPERHAAMQAMSQARILYGVDADPGWAVQIAAANERHRIALHLYSLSTDRSTLALHCGEMTVAEFRTIKAVLQWQARMLDPELPAATAPQS